MAQPPPNGYQDQGYSFLEAEYLYPNSANFMPDWNWNGITAFPGQIDGRGNAPAYPSYPTTPGAAGSPASSYLGTPDTDVSSANASQEPGRKRSFASLGDVDVAGSKRASVNASPSLAPGNLTSLDRESFLSPQMAYSSNHPSSRAPAAPTHYEQISPLQVPALSMPYRPNAAESAFESAYSTPPAVAGPSSSRQQSQSWVSGRDYIDLTGDDEDDTPIAADSPTVDPFSDLDLLYQPGQPQRRPSPADAFNQDFMSQEQLAAFLFTPGEVHLPNPVPFMANQRAPTQQAQQAPSADSDADDKLFDDPELDGMLDAPGAGSETLAALIANITPDDIPKERRQQTPARMKSQLKEHQKIALGWLMKKEATESSKGSLLADEMGLGKTIEALALIVARPSDDPRCKTTLIIAPVALMYQWKEEIECHIKPEDPLDVFVYHGSGKKATFDQLRKYDIVLTTFGTLASEYKAKESRKEAAHDAHEPWPLIAKDSMWYRVVMDEAQCIKNKNTLTSKATDDLQAHYRLCMTGTPMMNSVDELYPLIRFLKLRPYNDWGRFRYDISRGIKDKKEHMQKQGYDRVRILLKSIMLRREKGTIIDGQPISSIPPKEVVKDMVTFSDDERALYTAIESKAQVKVNRYLRDNQVTNNYANILVMLLRLRQACCHPHLIKDLGVQASTEGIPEEELLARAHQLDENVIGRLKNVESGFECPICYDPTVNPTIFIPCGHTCCGECFQKLMDPAAAIGDGGERPIPKCPECRATLSGERITDYVHFCKVHQREKLQELGFEDVQEAVSEDEDDDSSSDEDDSDLDDFIVPDDADDDYVAPATGSKSKGKKKKSKKPKEKGKEKGIPKTLAQLKKDSLRSAAAKKLYHKRLRKGFESSTKIDKTVAILEQIYADNPQEKTLIFSQWTSLLDLLEIPLVDKKIRYQRYDGAMTMEDRAKAVGKFMKNPDQRVMIMSLKAGNAGLNLTEASHVIILDPFWNPFIEDQAVGRVHRMHQTRQVHVHRVLVEDTVEHRICEIQDAKRQMVETALDERAHKSLSRLGVGELLYLFGIRGRPNN